MKNVSISLTNQHAAEIDTEIASGDYASVSEVVRAALREFLSRNLGPDTVQIDRDIAEYLDARKSDEPLISGADAQSQIRARLTQ